MDKNEKQNCAVTLMPLEPLEKGSTKIREEEINKSNSSPVSHFPELCCLNAEFIVT